MILSFFNLRRYDIKLSSLDFVGFCVSFLNLVSSETKEEWEALTDLRKDDSIIITKPDKGNGVVIVNKLDYLNKMKLLVSDETKFTKAKLLPSSLRPASINFTAVLI